MTQKTGALIFDETADRYDIRFDLDDYYGGLHCGECLKCCTRQMEADPHESTGTTGILSVSAPRFERLRVRI